MAPVRSSTYNWGDLVTSTLEGRSSAIADNITTQTALLDRLRRRGNIGTWSGGRNIVENLEYAFNESFMWYNGLNLAPKAI